MTPTVERLSAPEERLAQVEDQLAIYQLLMTYGRPIADSGCDEVGAHCTPTTPSTTAASRRSTAPTASPR